MKAALKYCFALLFLPLELVAQEDKPRADSTIIIRDSVVYRSVDQISDTNRDDSAKYIAVQRFSGKSKVAKLVYRALFRPLGREKKPELSSMEREEAFYHRSSQNRIIRNIRIVTLDPFGYELRDSTETAERLLMKAGNFLHAKTSSSVIKNLLLFRENEKYDSLLIKESERLIRSQDYIRDVYLFTQSASRDSIDVTIRVLDVWSLVPSAALSPSVTSVGIRDLNFAGTGHNLDASTLWRKPGGANLTSLRYFMPNILNSYTSVNLQYLFSPNGNLSEAAGFDKYFFTPVSYNPQYLFSDNPNIIRSIEVNRPFYATVTRWAGGMFLGQVMATQSYEASDSLRFITHPTNIQDYWLGHSFRFSNGRDMITSLVIAGRLVTTRTPQRSSQAREAGLFSPHTFYFASLNLISRKYFRDRYVFNYGKIEDVPAGRSIGLTFGQEYRQRNRYYIGLSTSAGTYYGFGYLGFRLSYGTFHGADGFHEGMISGSVNFFTRLLDLGNWKIRQFVSPSFIYGINHLPVPNQPLKIGIKGFESIESHASNITVVSLQTQSYAPWNLAGFHFGPYFFSHIGFMGEEPPSGTRKSRVYSLMGFGILIKNDYLMFKTFQVSLSFYPFIPGRGYNLFRTNSYKASDYGFRDFDVTKPGIVE